MRNYLLQTDDPIIYLLDYLIHYLEVHQLDYYDWLFKTSSCALFFKDNAKDNFKEKGIFPEAIFLGGVKVPSTKIVINFPWTQEKLSKIYIGSAVSKVVSHTET